MSDDLAYRYGQTQTNTRTVLSRGLTREHLSIVHLFTYFLDLRRNRNQSPQNVQSILFDFFTLFFIYFYYFYYFPLPRSFTQALPFPAAPLPTHCSAHCPHTVRARYFTGRYTVTVDLSSGLAPVDIQWTYLTLKGEEEKKLCLSFAASQHWTKSFSG